VTKKYRSYSPSQSYLLPPSPTEWLPEGHLAYFVMDLVQDLDLGEIEGRIQAKDARGERPFSPRLMTSLLLYGYAVGVTSSRKIEKATFEDVGFRVISAGEHPHFTTINDFRAAHRQALANLFKQVLVECMSAGLVKLGHVAIDGTKMKANASKHKAMSFERMNKEETKLKAEIEAWFDRADEVDAEEDRRYGVGQQQHDLPEELRRREGRLAKIRQVREALKKETAKARAKELEQLADGLRERATETTDARQQAEFLTRADMHDQQAGELDPGDDDDPPPPAVSIDDDLPRNTPPKHPNGLPKPKAQRNFTDAESRIMLRDGAFIQAYNAQIAVDESPHQIIVAAALSNPGPDAEYFEPILRRVVENCDAVPTWVTADSGYFSVDGVRAAESLGAEPFIAVGGHQRNGLPKDTRQVTEAHVTDRQQMRALLESPRGRAAYARRKATVEPVFGQIRACRGFRQMSFRGLWKNRCEWLFVCATHNLLKLWRAATTRQLALAA